MAGMLLNLIVVLSAFSLYRFLHDRKGWKKAPAATVALVVWLVLALVKAAVMDYFGYLLG